MHPGARMLLVFLRNQFPCRRRIHRCCLGRIRLHGRVSRISIRENLYIVRFLLSFPEYEFILRDDLDNTPHGIVSSSAHLVAGDFIFKIRIIQFLFHFIGGELGNEPKSSRSAWHGIHLLTKIDQPYVMDHVPGINDQLHGLVLHDVHFVPDDDIILCIRILPDQSQGIIILIADILVVLLSKGVVFPGVAEYPAELFAGDFHLQGVFRSLAGDTEPIEQAKTDQYGKSNSGYNGPDHFQPAVMGQVKPLSLIPVLEFVANTQQEHLGNYEYDPGDRDRDVHHRIDLLAVYGCGFTKDLSPEQFVAPVDSDQSQYEERDHEKTIDAIGLLKIFLFAFHDTYVLTALTDRKIYMQPNHPHPNQTNTI